MKAHFFSDYLRLYEAVIKVFTCVDRNAEI